MVDFLHLFVTNLHGKAGKMLHNPDNAINISQDRVKDVITFLVEDRVTRDGKGIIGKFCLIKNHPRMIKQQQSTTKVGLPTNEWFTTILLG